MRKVDVVDTELARIRRERKAREADSGTAKDKRRPSSPPRSAAADQSNGRRSKICRALLLVQWYGR